LTKACAARYDWFRGKTKMPIIDRLYDETFKCSCGRLAREIHCSDCGSFNVEGKTKVVEIEVEVEGRGLQRLYLKQWKCRRCGFRFNERDRLRCHAPEQGLSIKAQRTADLVTETIVGIPENERRAKLEEMFGKKLKGPVNDTKTP
jgi:hypothetical protein